MASYLRIDIAAPPPPRGGAAQHRAHRAAPALLVLAAAGVFMPGRSRLPSRPDKSSTDHTPRAPAAPAGRSRRTLPRASSAAAVLACACLALTSASAAAAAAPRPTAADSTATAGPTTLEQIREWNLVGRCGDAERAVRALLPEAERLHGAESVQVAELLDELAVALRRSGKIGGPEFLAVCERAVRIKERAFGTRDPRYATSLHNLGMAHYVLKDFTRAQDILEETLRIREAALGSNHPDIAKTLLALGALQSDLGNLERARPLTERGVAIEEIALGRSNPDRALGVNSLACLRYSMGDLAASIPLFEEAISLWEQAPARNQAALSTCYHNMGIVLDELGDHARASTLLERAARIREAEGDWSMLAISLIALGDAYRGKGDLPRSKAALRRAIGILSTAEPRDPESLGWAFTSLGWTYLAEGNRTGARDAFQRGLDSKVEALGPDHPSLWLNLRGLAAVAHREGRTEQAREYYTRAVDLVRRTSGPMHPDLGLTLAEYATFQLAAGESLGALETALQAAEINRAQVKLTAQGVSESQALTYTSDLDTGMDVALAALSGTLRARSGDLVSRAWDALVRSRAAVLDEAAERARLVEGAGGILKAANRLESARTRLANLLVRGSSSEDAGSGRSQIPAARDEVDRCERELAARSVQFRAGYDRASVGLDRVLSSLPPGTGLVSIACHGQGRARAYVAFVVPPGGPPAFVPLGPADDMDRLIERWRRLAGKPPRGGAADRAQSERDCQAAGAALRARLWDPLARPLSGAKLALLVPDGALQLVNLAALPDGNGGYVVEAPLVVHYLSAERDIARMEAPRSRGTGLLAVGDPDFDRPERALPPGPPVAAAPEAGDRAGTALAYRAALADCGEFRSVRFPPLPETGREVAEIVGLWGRPSEAVALEGETAGERSVKALVAGRRVVHIATHGFFLDARCGRRGDAASGSTRGIGGIDVVGRTPPAPGPATTPLLVTGLALAGANLRANAPPEEEDGILTAEEIASLGLSGVDWVVLSACDTGLGDVRAGEGVLGIRRAFEAAGAGTLIMSLWGVEDRATREWMRGLYDARLRRNLGTAEAVREADLSALRSLRAQGRSTHPFYWAAFVAAGDWR